MLEHITEALAAEIAAGAITPEQVRAFNHPVIPMPAVMPIVYRSQDDIAEALAIQREKHAVTKYRKKPVVIEARRYDGSNSNVIIDWVGAGRELAPDAYTEGTELYIATLEGAMHASVGDYIIRGVQGEFYPCKPDIFEATYERV